MSTEPRPRFRLVLEAQDHPDGVPAIHRLRALLKHALRALRLKCVEAVEGGGPEQPPPPQAAREEERR